MMSCVVGEWEIGGSMMPKNDRYKEYGDHYS